MTDRLTRLNNAKIYLRRAIDKLEQAGDWAMQPAGVQFRIEEAEQEMVNAYHQLQPIKAEYK